MIFNVTPEHIEKLDDSDLRELVGYLAEQEILKAGYSPKEVTWGGHQNAPDGGIDVRVSLENGKLSGYVPNKQTGFQVKAQAMPPMEIQREMRPKGKLRESIVELAGKNGAYIIVSSKESVSDTSLKKRKEAMQNALSDLPDNHGLDVDFYDQRRISSWANQNPGLIFWVHTRTGLPTSGWQPFKDWSSSPGNENEDYCTDDHLQLIKIPSTEVGKLGIIDGINQLRKILAQEGKAIRLAGFSGVGKTRLVQALFDKRLGADPISPHYAVYTDLSDSPDPPPLELLKHIQNLEQRCVLIIDNCGLELHRKLVTEMGRSNSRVSLVTVEYDINDDIFENTDVFRLEPASNEIIEKVISRQYPKFTPVEVRTIAKFSEGNYRIALLISETAKQGGSLANLNDSELFKRLFWQKKCFDPELFRSAKVCSLVYSFDWETTEGDNAELPVLAGLAGYDIKKFRGHIAELKRRLLVQKRGQWRAFLPQALAHRLAKQALEDIPTVEILDTFAHRAPERLLKSFSYRLGHLHDSDEAQEIATAWLKKGSRLSEIENLSHLEHTLLHNIAPVVPGKILECYENSAARDNALFKSPRLDQYDTVILLRKLAYESKHFERAITLIASFIEAMEERNAPRDTCDIFKSLFMLYLSGTQAKANIRTRAINKLAETGKEWDAELALIGLNSMLQTSDFVSYYEFYFGSRNRDFGYWPKPQHEKIEWFDEVFKLILYLENLPHLRERVRKLVAERLSELIVETGLTDKSIALAEKFMADEGWPEGWVGACTSIKFLKDPNRAEDFNKVRLLIERLKPTTFKDKISVYITPEESSLLDVVRGTGPTAEDRKRIEEEIDEIVRGVGKDLVADFVSLEEHLPTLVKAESCRRLNIFFDELAMRSTDILRVWKLVYSAIFNARSSVPYGTLNYDIAAFFVQCVAAHDRMSAEVILDEALKDKDLHPILISMQLKAGLNDRGVKRVLTAANIETVPINTFFSLARYNILQELSSDKSAQILKEILQRKDGLIVAIEIMGVLSNNKNKLLTNFQKSIGREILLKAITSQLRVTEIHQLSFIAEACLDCETDESTARQICNQLFEAIISYRLHSYGYKKFMAVLVRKFPKVVLEELFEVWLNTNENPKQIGELDPASNINHEVMFQWANEQDTVKRHRCLAQFIPILDEANGTVSKPNGIKKTSNPIRWTACADRLIRSTSDIDSVLEIFIERFFPIFWAHSRVNILESRLPLLEALSNDPENRIAISASKYLRKFNEEIKLIQEKENQEAREQNESFE